MAKFANEIAEVEMAFDATTKQITNVDALALLNTIPTRELTSNGVKRTGSAGSYVFSVEDDIKFAAWVQAHQPEEIIADDEASGLAQVWLTNDKEVEELQPKDEDLLEGLVQAYSFRRSRGNRNTITAVGFRVSVIDQTGRVRNRRVSIHINYAKTVVAALKGVALAAVTDSAVEAWAKDQKDKGLLFQVRTQEKGRTGYYAKADALNTREQEAYNRLADKSKAVSRTTAGTKYIGFVHVTSGESYSISSELTDIETEALVAAVETAKASLAKALETRMVKEAEVAGEETRIEARLKQLQSLVANKLISKEEANTRRVAILASL
jgi:hypothetical protein